MRRDESVLALRWEQSAVAAAPAPSSVHVWAAPLSVANERVERLAQALSPDEQARASRFRTHDLQVRFVTARGMLREILGAYLGMRPEDIRFQYDARQKPSLAPAMPAPALHFNVAHSGDLALYAVATDGAVGVDVELMTPLPDARDIAGSFFSKAEQRALSVIPERDQCAAFYRIWTRKEAYLKATGMGLFTPLESFDVSVAADERPAVLRIARTLPVSAQEEKQRARSRHRSCSASCAG